MASPPTSPASQAPARQPPSRAPRTLLCVLSAVVLLGSAPAPTDRERYRSALAADWREVVRDDGTTNWRDVWTLDGEQARVSNDENGMTFSAGPTWGDDASHAVLWTKRSFEGDIKIEYEYTRLDSVARGVNIIYLLATGSGEGPYAEDIAAWRTLRRVPAMRIYFRNMNTYHISYAAYPTREDDAPTDYVRARRYMPDRGMGLRGTGLEPDSQETGLFETGVPYRITVVKSGGTLFMHVRNPTDERLFAWELDAFPDLTHGRVGLRHMYTRSSRYKNIRISVARTPE